MDVRLLVPNTWYYTRVLLYMKLMCKMFFYQLYYEYDLNTKSISYVLGICYCLNFFDKYIRCDQLAIPDLKNANKYTYFICIEHGSDWIRLCVCISEWITYNSIWRGNGLQWTIFPKSLSPLWTCYDRHKRDWPCP